MLDEQHKYISYYVVENAPRITRIIELLEKNEKNFSSKKNSEAYKPLLNFLRELIKKGEGKNGLLQLIEEQKNNLDHWPSENSDPEQKKTLAGKVVKKFLKRELIHLHRYFLDKEKKLTLKILKPLKKIDSEKIKAYKKIPFERRSNLLMRIVHASLGAILTGSLLFGAIAYQNRHHEGGYIYSTIACEILEEKNYHTIMRFKGDKEWKRFDEVLKEWENETHKLAVIQHQFEADTGIEAVGEFSIADLEKAKKYILSFGRGSESSAFFNLKKIYFFPINAEILTSKAELDDSCSKNGETQKMFHLGGLAMHSKESLLIPSASASFFDLDKLNYELHSLLEGDLQMRILAHELAHMIHSKIMYSESKYFDSFNSILEHHNLVDKTSFFKVNTTDVHRVKAKIDDEPLRIRFDFRRPSYSNLKIKNIAVSSVTVEPYVKNGGTIPSFINQNDVEKKVLSILDQLNKTSDKKLSLKDVKNGNVKVQIIYFMPDRHPDSGKFNDGWALIEKGGYARDYGKFNQHEDIATVVEAVIQNHLEGVPPSKIKPMNNNPENLLKFRLKILWLYYHGFFPPGLHMDFTMDDLFPNH